MTASRYQHTGLTRSPRTKEHCVRKKAAGFTLIELMITVAIVAILSAIAYPSYQEYVLRTRRVEAMDLLGEAAARQERWRAQNGGYTTTIANLKLAHGDKSEHGYYTLSIAAAAGDGGYTLKATRTGSQVADGKCGDFTLNALGVKGVSVGTVAVCWL
ncbi:type IV pilin protein [Delftia acidovorans]|uniref:Type IV pilin protein n=1 Tax=Delftia acidovorans TaxID=80866 RepID=A0A7T2S701_DELAC|nr:type IV pilin protein [Delftia acidovorans]